MMMGTVCADQQHKFCSLLNRKIDIPPRKQLLTRRTSPEEMYLVDSPRSTAEEAFLQKYLPYNNPGDDDDEEGDPYSSDHFRMYEFKVRRCTRSRSHDWTDCPFAHPGEKARRRDPRRFHYSGTVCAEFRRGSCSRGDNCEFAHGVFECWLHPARYRTEACKDGKNCKRKVCFFAHTPRQLRLLPSDSPPMNSPVSAENRKYRKQTNCCLFCHSVTASPTSTLMGMSHFSPPMSPPHSPSPATAAKSRSVPGFSPISRYADRFEGFDYCGGAGSGSVQFNNGSGFSYKDVLNELVNSMDSMNVNEEIQIPHAVNSNNGRNLSWVDVNFNNGVDEQQQFVMSPSTPNPRNFFRSDSSSSPSAASGSSFLSRGGFIDEKQSNNSYNNGLASSSACPDLGWVNDLLT